MLKLVRKKKDNGKMSITNQLKIFDWSSRLSVFDKITSSLSTVVNGDQLCIVDKRLGETLVIGEKFGTPSVNGEAWKAISLAFKDQYVIAIKKVPIESFDTDKSFTIQQLTSGISAWSEIAAHVFCNVLVMSRVTPNLPLLYKYTYCPTCKFVKRRGDRKMPCILLLNEMAEGDLWKFFKRKIWTDDMLKSCVFQITTALYALEKFYGISHNDLHPGNILVHEVSPGGIWEYKIDDKVYQVPNLGFVFVVWDFGDIHIPGHIRGRGSFPLHGKPDEETDIGRICYIIREQLRKHYKGFKSPMLNDIIKNEKSYTLRKIIKTHLRYFLKRGNDENRNIIDKFNMDIAKSKIRAAHPPELARYVMR